MTNENNLEQIINKYNDCSKEIEKLKKKVPFFIGIVLILPFFTP